MAGLPGTSFDASKARRHLDERLAMAGFVRELDVEFEVVPRLEVDARTGKFRRLVSLGPPSESPAAVECRASPSNAEPVTI